MKLEPGQVAVLTGGASGIGLALAQALADHGLNLVLADVEQGALDAAAARLAGTVEVESRVVDVRDAAALRGLADATLERFGRVDLVGAIAGVAGGIGPFWEVPEEEWRWVIDVNYWGVVNTLRAFLPHLVQQGNGHVVNVASLAALAPLAFSTAYSSSKSAILGLSRELRLELDEVAPAVGVTTLYPGVVRTRIRDSGRNRPHADPGVGEHRPVPPPEDTAIEPEQLIAAVVRAIENDIPMVAGDAYPAGLMVDELRAMTDVLSAEL